MNATRLVLEHRLGTHSENTVDALKEVLGVDQLELVVLNSVEEYSELVVEVPTQIPFWTRRRMVTNATLAVVSLLLILFVPAQTLVVEHWGDDLLRMIL